MHAHTNTHTHKYTIICLDPNDMKLARTLFRPHEERWKGRDTGMEKGLEEEIQR